MIDFDEKAFSQVFEILDNLCRAYLGRAKNYPRPGRLKLKFLSHRAKDFTDFHSKISQPQSVLIPSAKIVENRVAKNFIFIVLN